MQATGYIQVRAFSSTAQLPLKDVSVTVTADDGTAIAMRLTDRSGRITPIEIPVPEASASQTPDTGLIPYTTVTLHARLQGYEQIRIDRLQVFAGTVTDQNLAFIPLSELPSAWNQSETFDTPPQNL